MKGLLLIHIFSHLIAYAADGVIGPFEEGKYLFFNNKKASIEEILPNEYDEEKYYPGLFIKFSENNSFSPLPSKKKSFSGTLENYNDEYWFIDGIPVKRDQEELTISQEAKGKYLNKKGLLTIDLKSSQKNEAIFKTLNQAALAYAQSISTPEVYLKEAHPNQEKQKYISDLCRKIIPFSSIPHLENEAKGTKRKIPKIKCTLLKGDTINAFATPTGEIYIYEGMIKNVIENEAQLVTVLGHELAHITQMHSIKRIKGFLKAIPTSLLTFIIAEGAAFSLQSYLRRKKNSNFLIQVVVGTGAAIGLHYLFRLAKRASTNYHSREDEFQADRVGAIYMTLAGYHPSEAFKLWQNMNKINPRKADLKHYIYGTHGTPSERASTLFYLYSVFYKNICDQLGCDRWGNDQFLKHFSYLKASKASL